MAHKIKHIVVLDDNQEFLTEASQMLSQHYTVTKLSSSELLGDFLASHSVNLLVLSAGLVTRYFVSLIADIRERWPGLPLILTYDDDSQYYSMRDHYHKLSAGVIRKPFEPDQFMSLVKQTLQDCSYSTLAVNKA